MGSGCGILSLMYAVRNPQSDVTGWDLYPPAVSEASENALINRLQHQVTFRHQDYTNHVEGEKFDLIISNPPYFLNSLAPGDGVRKLAKHHPGQDYQEFLNAICRLMTDEGKALLILPVEQLNEMYASASHTGLFLYRCLDIISVPGKSAGRCIISLHKQPFTQKQASEQLILQNSAQRNDWSQAYLTFMGDFKVS